MSTPRLAATVLLCQPTSVGRFSLLMIRRAAKSRFMPGAHVFPGGVLEDADKDQAWETLVGQNLSQDARAIRITCIRELFEETNVLLTRPRLPSSTEKKFGGIIAKKMLRSFFPCVIKTRAFQ